jgi:hypothetical protein
LDTTALADNPRRKSHRRSGLITPSTFDRLAGDAYFTIEAPWIVPALLKHVRVAGRILEPCAGRGHLVVELRKRGLEVAARDLVAHEDPLVGDIETPLDMDAIKSLAGFNWLVTNPPFTRLDERIEHLLRLCVRDGCNIALLLRQEWTAPEKRGALIHDNPNFAGMIALTARPRWIEDPGESPRHHFVWCVWRADPRAVGVPAWLRFAGRGARRLMAKPDSACPTLPPESACATEEPADTIQADEELGGSIPPTINGEFAGEIVAGAFGPFSAGRERGGSCVLRLERRDGSPFDVRLKFLTSGPPHIVLRDARALVAWVEAVGAPPTAGFTALGENLWIAGRGKRVLFDVRTHEDHRGLPEVVIVNVRVERTNHA